MLVDNNNFPTADMDSAIQQAISKFSKKQNANYFRLDKKFEFIHAIFESFMASNRSSSPKLKLMQPPPSSLYSEPFVLLSK